MTCAECDFWNSNSANCDIDSAAPEIFNKLCPYFQSDNREEE